MKAWLWLLPILVGVPPVLAYRWLDYVIDIPFIGTIDLANEVAAEVAMFGFMLWVGITISLLPTLIAFGRWTRNRGTVAGVNLLLGLTGVGWIVALALSFTSDVERFVGAPRPRRRPDGGDDRARVGRTAVSSGGAGPASRSTAPRRHKPWLVAAAGLVVAAATVAGLQMVTNDETPRSFSGVGASLSSVSGALVEPATLTACTDDVPFPPFMVPDPDAPSGYRGFDVDILHAIADRLGLTLRIVDARFDAIASGAAMSDGRCDLGASVITITQDRERVVDFTDPYLDHELALVVGVGAGIASLADLAGQEIGVPGGTVAEAWARTRVPPTTRIVAFADLTALHVALENGEVTGILGYAPTLIERSRLDDRTDVVTTFATDNRYGFVVRERGAEELLEAVNEALTEIRSDGTYDTLYATYFAP